MSSSHDLWSVAPTDVGAPEARALLRAYLTDVSDSYFRLRLGRPSTADEIEEGLAAFPSDDLTPPTGLFLVGRYADVPAGCAGLRVRDTGTVELTRMFVRPEARGTGGGGRLLAAADDAARALGAYRIVLDTRRDLVAARTLYLRHGYVEVPAYDDRPYAEVWYARDLRAPAAPRRDG